MLNEKLVVEIDGGQHQQQQIYDMRRTVFLEQAGYRVIRFWNDDVLTKTDSVLQVIYDALGDPSPQPSPRSRGEGDE
jgi:very-short-patch-repair endonuclease